MTTPQNDFLTFSAGSGANVITQAQYASMTSLLANGFQTGVAPSAQLNKVWRQSSIMSAVIAAFVTANTGQSVIDDGTTATILANYQSAIMSVTLGQLSSGSVNPTLGPVTTLGSTSNTSECDVVMQSSGHRAAWYMLPTGEAGLNDATSGINRFHSDVNGNFFVPTAGSKTYIAKTSDDGTGAALQVNGIISVSAATECDMIMQSSGKKVNLYLLSSGESGMNDGVAGINRFKTDNSGNFFVPTSGTKTYLARSTDDGTGSTLQVNGTATFSAGTQSAHGATLGQIAGIVGMSRNASMPVDTASSSATFKADEIIVESALGGLKYAVANINLTVNLATTGDGGMDSGTAPTSGFVALYLLYNPIARTATIRAVNATSGVATEIYPNSYPGSYTASALIAVYPTDSSGRFIAGNLTGRDVVFSSITAISGSTQQPSLTAISISSAVPANAKSVSGFVNYGSSAASNTTVQLSPSTNQVGLIPFFLAVNAAAAETVAFTGLRIRTTQSICYLATVSGGTISFTIFINGYSF
ncbi:hypothetical protein [Chromobacterium violaceum]|uniref:hypothetical protein n=1 Tax=Chromobacterium violaceum TaxID=536 RepID=UPI000AA3C0F0|nr:hypothetical protein [Chromobacterium violaceum]